MIANGVFGGEAARFFFSALKKTVMAESETGQRPLAMFCGSLPVNAR